MVEVEERVTGRDEEVTAGVTAHGVVTSTVYTQAVCSWYTLHDHLELPDVLLVDDEVGDGGRVSPLLVAVVGQVACQTSGVVGEAVAVCDLGSVGCAQSDGAKVDLWNDC